MSIYDPWIITIHFWYTKSDHHSYINNDDYYLRCQNCRENRIVYQIGWNSYCYKCAIDEYSLHSFTCEVCGQIYFNNHVKSPDEYGLCKNCRDKCGKEYERVRNNNSRTSKLGLPSTLKLKEWLTILDKYNYKCFYCGGNYQELDHVIAVRKGGGTTRDNVVPCCHSCNMKKRSKKGIVTSDGLCYNDDVTVPSGSFLLAVESRFREDPGTVTRTC